MNPLNAQHLCLVQNSQVNRLISWRLSTGLSLKPDVLTWGLWAGVTSFSSCFCCCRSTRLCVWACCSWNCWAIAFSLSGYNWASRERICYFQHQKTHISGRASENRSALQALRPCYLIFKYHPEWTLLLQLLPQLYHLSPQVLSLLLLQNVRWANPFIFLLCTLPLRGRTTKLLRPEMK